MLAIHERCAPREDFDAELLLPFELRQKTRLRTQTTAGEEAGLFLARGSVLRDGDFLQAADGRLVKVTAKPENVLHVDCADPVQLARIAYHLGNRHVALQIGAGWLRISNDYVLAQMIEGLGATAVVIEAPFEPESGAYGGHRHEGTEAPVHQGIIHQYVATGS